MSEPARSDPELAGSPRTGGRGGPHGRRTRRCTCADLPPRAGIIRRMGGRTELDEVVAAIRAAATGRMETDRRRDLGTRFERLIREAFETCPSMGFDKVQMWEDWSNAPDLGVDLVARDGETVQLTAIQCKCWTKPITVEAVNSFLAESGQARFAKRILVHTAPSIESYGLRKIRQAHPPCMVMDRRDLARLPVDWWAAAEAAGVARRPRRGGRQVLDGPVPSGGRSRYVAPMRRSDAWFWLIFALGVALAITVVYGGVGPFGSDSPGSRGSPGGPVVATAEADAALDPPAESVVLAHPDDAARDLLRQALSLADLLYGQPRSDGLHCFSDAEHCAAVSNQGAAIALDELAGNAIDFGVWRRPDNLPEPGTVKVQVNSASNGNNPAVGPRDHNGIPGDPDDGQWIRLMTSSASGATFCAIKVAHTEDPQYQGTGYMSVDSADSLSFDTAAHCGGTRLGGASVTNTSCVHGANGPSIRDDNQRDLPGVNTAATACWTMPDLAEPSAYPTL